MVKHFQSHRDSQVVLWAQPKARGNGHPFHKPQKRPRHPLAVVHLVQTVEHYDYHPHMDNGAESFQGSEKQDTLEPALAEGALQSESPVGDTPNERPGLGYCRVNGKCREPLWNNWPGYIQGCNTPQSMRQYLPQRQVGTVDRMLHLCKNSNSGLAILVLWDMYLGKEPDVVQ